MTDVPTFFFSHARQDRETPGNYLRCFFDDLEIKLAQWSGISLKEKRLGTIDARVPQARTGTRLKPRTRKRQCLRGDPHTLYFNRPNCGKEMGVFLLRSPVLGVDCDGSLTGAKNLLLIRWLPENAYMANTSKDS